MKDVLKNYEELPLMLDASTLSRTLGISRAGAYDLMNSKNFPTLRVGKRMMVSKVRLMEWVDRNSGNM